MKAWAVVLAVAVLACGFGWFQSCASLHAERKVHRLAWASYQDSLSRWAPIRDSLTREATRLARAYATARARVPASAETVRVLLARGADSTEGLLALGRILEAGDRCDQAFGTCTARLQLETRARVAADSAAANQHRWALSEVRAARAWKPFSLRPPGLLWAGALLLACGVVLR